MALFWPVIFNGNHGMAWHGRLIVDLSDQSGTDENLYANSPRLYGVCQIHRDPYWFFLEVVSRESMPDDILARAKFYLPIQQGRMATELHVNGKFIILFFSRGQSYRTSCPQLCQVMLWSRQTQTIQEQMKARASSTAMKAERNP